MSKKHKSSHASPTKSAYNKDRGARKVIPIWVWIVLAASILAVGVFWVLSSKSVPAVRSSTAVEISPDQANEKILQGAFILDVRTQAEYDQTHIADSTLIELSELPDRLDELPREREIVVVCRSGNRSKQALSVLQDAGITRASSMAGGIKAWSLAGYPTQATTP
jgi:rhodanese-related sulfurtransferase